MSCGVNSPMARARGRRRSVAAARLLARGEQRAAADERDAAEQRADALDRLAPVDQLSSSCRSDRRADPQVIGRRSGSEVAAIELVHREVRGARRERHVRERRILARRRRHARAVGDEHVRRVPDLVVRC